MGRSRVSSAGGGLKKLVEIAGNNFNNSPLDVCFARKAGLSLVKTEIEEIFLGNK